MENIFQLKKIFNYEQKRGFIYLFLIMLIYVLLEVAVLKSLLIILNFFSDHQQNMESNIFLFLKNLETDLAIHLLIIFLFIIIFLIKTLTNILLNHQRGKFLFFTRADLSSRLMKGYLYMPRVFHMRTNTSELVRNITVEVENVITALLNLLTITLEILVLVGLVIFLSFVSFKVTLISFFALIFFSFIVSGVNRKKTIILGKKRVELINKRLKNIIEALTGSKTLTITGSRDKALVDFNENNTQIASVSQKNYFRNNLPKPLFELFTVLLIGVLFTFVQQKNIQISTIIPTLGVFLAAIYRLIPSFAHIMSGLQSYQFNIQSLTNLSIDFKKFKNLKKISEANVKYETSLNLKNVSFSYENIKNKQIFKNLNLVIKKGSKIGIVGLSGSGKSTFLDLIMGLLPVDDGEILIDEKNLKNNESGWQKKIGCVPQEVFIIDDSLKRNIAFGEIDERINNQELSKAIELAGLKDFVQNLENKENTIIGERGSRLSGGQRQRIGIARAFYNKPEVIILDEATNALDEQTETKIVKDIFETCKDKTIIFVSHNSRNLKYCDIIYQIKNQTFSTI